MKKLILHIPHSSIQIPSFDGYIISDALINKEVLKLTDWHTEELFSNTFDDSIVAPVSRIFCDMERFADDEKEIMSKKGMGVLYTHTDDGKRMREFNKGYRKNVLESYYFPHHLRLSQSAQNQLDNEGNSVIIDCHSFSEDPFERDHDKNLDRPDICIGTDSFHTSKELLRVVEDGFKKIGYSVKINSPYGGTIVPSEFNGTNSNVYSIMIEINRKLYLDKCSKEKSKNYSEVMANIQKVLSEVRDSVF